MPKFTEAQLEEAIIELFQEQGYDYINGDKLHRKYDEILLEEDMREFLSQRYSNLTATELEKVIMIRIIIPVHTRSLPRSKR